MSLYYTQKLLYDLNRDPGLRQRFLDQPEPVLGGYDLTDEERDAFRRRDIGLLYVLGVNGQLLDVEHMHALARSTGRPARQRTTLYGRPQPVFEPHQAGERSCGTVARHRLNGAGETCAVLTVV